MARRLKGESSPLRTLFAAWLVLLGLTFVPLVAYYQSRDLPIPIGLIIAATTVVVIGLIIAVGLPAIAAGDKAEDSPVEAGGIANLRQRGAVFGRR